MRRGEALIGSVLILFCFLIAQDQKESILFESALKDAVFSPDLSRGQTLSPSGGMYGWWTLKFENGAVILHYSTMVKLSQWWIGETYVVSTVIGPSFEESHYKVERKSEKKDS
jgi:hypothetical protein